MRRVTRCAADAVLVVVIPLWLVFALIVWALERIVIRSAKAVRG